MIGSSRNRPDRFNSPLGTKSDLKDRVLMALAQEVVKVDQLPLCKIGDSFGEEDEITSMPVGAH